MKICFLTSTLETTGGVQRVLTTLANELSDKYDIAVLCERKQHSEKIQYKFNRNIALESINIEDEHSIDYFCGRVIRKADSLVGLKWCTSLQKYGAYPFSVRKRYMDFLDSYKPDIIIAAQGRYSLLLSLLSDKLECLCIGWFHNSYKAYFETRGFYYYNQKKAYQEEIKKLDACVCLTKQDESIYNCEIAQKFICIYNPLTVIPDNSYDSPKKNYALFVGRIEYETKGIDYLLQIAKLCKSSYSQFQLVIVGTGNDAARLKSEITYDEAADYIVYEGESNKVEQYYREASVVLNTSRWEGFGLVITEALSFGVPVVSFDTEGPMEILENGYDGYIVNDFNTAAYAERVISIMTNAEIYQRMRKNALNKASRFQISNIRKQWESLFLTIEGKRKNENYKDNECN